MGGSAKFGGLVTRGVLAKNVADTKAVLNILVSCS
jgi:hypothetical protein